MREGGREVPKTKRILELNPDHDVIRKLRAVFERDGADPRVGEFARLLHGQAVIAEGGELDDPVEFARALSGVMASAMSDASS